MEFELHRLCAKKFSTSLMFLDCTIILIWSGWRRIRSVRMHSVTAHQCLLTPNRIVTAIVCPVASPWLFGAQKVYLALKFYPTREIHFCSFILSRRLGKIQALCVDPAAWSKNSLHKCTQFQKSLNLFKISEHDTLLFGIFAHGLY